MITLAKWNRWLFRADTGVCPYCGWRNSLESYRSPLGGRMGGSYFSQMALEASLGMRQSPRGERLTLPTFGPSGRQERLNC